MIKIDLTQLKKLDTLCRKHHVDYKIELFKATVTKITLSFSNKVYLVIFGFDSEFNERMKGIVETLSKMEKKEKE